MVPLCFVKQRNMSVQPDTSRYGTQYLHAFEVAVKSFPLNR